MSGSYQQLLQKYNQLLALVLNLGNNIVRSGSASIPAGVTTGTIPFGITFPNIPEVVISQVGGFGPIVGLAVLGVTTTDFTWQSNGADVGAIIFIANYN